MFHGAKTFVKSALSFKYIVSLPPNGDRDESPFQLFPFGYLEVAWAFKLLGAMPRDAFELILPPDQMARERMTGRGITAMAASTDRIDKMANMFKEDMVVILSATEEIGQLASAAIRQVEFPVLHLAATAPQADRSDLIAHAETMANRWSADPSRNGFAKLLQQIVQRFKETPISRTTVKLNDPSHFVTQPNIVALRACGFDASSNTGPIIQSIDNDIYFDAINSTVQAIGDIRDRIFNLDPAIRHLSSVDLILTVPSVSKIWNRRIDEKLLPGTGLNQKLLKRLGQDFFGRSTYSIVIPGQFNDGTLADNRMVNAMLNIYRSELELTTSSLALRAASHFAPVIRLPSGHNDAENELGKFVSAVRRSDERQNPHKINRLARGVSERLALGVPDWVISKLKTIKKIKLVSDAPLEWMDIDGIPLMLRANVSRIPSTPGSLNTMQMLCAAEFYIPKTAFGEVLLLRSFEKDDPLKEVVSNMIKVMAEGQLGFPKITVVDVKNRQEMIDALNKYDGALLIFNGHGEYLEQEMKSQLVLADEMVDPSTLRSVARVPPIVVLAACDTQPLDGSQWTSANGFLIAGAMSVLATAMPVTADAAARIVARLISRIAHELPLLLERPWRSLRWSEVLPGLQRSEYALYAIARLRDNGIVRMTEEEYDKLLHDIHMQIIRDKDWIAVLIAGIERYRIGSSPGQALLKRHCGFIESMVFVQLGNPEGIVVWDPEVPNEWYEQFSQVIPQAPSEQDQSNHGQSLS